LSQALDSEQAGDVAGVALDLVEQAIPALDAVRNEEGAVTQIPHNWIEVTVLCAFRRRHPVILGTPTDSAAQRTTPGSDD
jgi:hypothetical protein